MVNVQKNEISSLTYFSHRLAVSKLCYTFAAVKHKSVINSKTIQGAMPLQKKFDFSVLFLSDYLVVPNNLLTHTHTHTFAPSV